jgi:hypothetical protein
MAEEQQIAGTAMAVIQETIVAFDAVESGIAELAQQYTSVAFAVDTEKGMTEAKQARIAIRRPRYAVETARKAAKSPLLELGREIDRRAKAITGRLLELEEPIDGQIIAEEQRREAEKERKRQEEIERIARHQSGIGEIAATALSAIGRSSARIEELRAELVAKVPAGFEEYQMQAERRHAEVVEKLGELLAEAQRKEAAERQAEADRLELARQRAEQERSAAAERERAAEERRAAASAQAAAAAEAERLMQAERDKLAAERAEFAREQAAARAAADAARRAQEEEARKAAEVAAQAERDRMAMAHAADAEAARLARIKSNRLAAEQAAADAALEKVRAAAPLLLDALRGLMAIVSESAGVAGYHLNGSIAEWDEFPEISAAVAAIAAAITEGAAA